MTALTPSASGGPERRRGRARPAFILSAIVGLVITFAGMQPAHALFTVDFTSSCTPSGRFISVTLGESGPGSFVDSEGISGSFGAITQFSYDIPGFSATSLTIDVTWDTTETATVTNALEPCVAPTTTTTSTTAPPATTTTTTGGGGGGGAATTVPTSVLAQQAAPAGTLARTGSDSTWLVFFGAILIAAGVVGVTAANRRAHKE